MYLPATTSCRVRWPTNIARSAWSIEHPIDLIRTPIGEFGHHAGYVYDFETLDAELQRAGFKPAVRRNLLESDDPMLQNLEERPTHGSLQMVVEAVRRVAVSAA